MLWFQVPITPTPLPQDVQQAVQIITPQITQALLSGATVVIGSVIAFVVFMLRFVPQVMDKRLKAYDAAQSIQRESQLQDIKDRAIAAQQKVEEATAEREVLKGLVSNTGELVNSISIMARNMVSDLSERVEMRKELAAHSRVQTDQTLAINEFGDKLDKLDTLLSSTGSKALQDLSKSVQDMLAKQDDQAGLLKENKSVLTEIISRITELQNSLTDYKRAAEIQLDTLTLSKTDGGGNVSISP